MKTGLYQLSMEAYLALPDANLHALRSFEHESRFDPSSEQKEDWILARITHHLRKDKTRDLADHVLCAIESDSLCTEICQSVAAEDPLEAGRRLADALTKYVRTIAEREWDQFGREEVVEINHER